MENIAAFGPLLPARPITEHGNGECVAIEDLTTARRIYRLAFEKLLKL